jgi:hypothetical protein
LLPVTVATSTALLRHGICSFVGTATQPEVAETALMTRPYGRSEHSGDPPFQCDDALHLTFYRRAPHPAGAHVRQQRLRRLGTVGVRVEQQVHAGGAREPWGSAEEAPQTRDHELVADDRAVEAASRSVRMSSWFAAKLSQNPAADDRRAPRVVRVICRVGDHDALRARRDVPQEAGALAGHRSARDGERHGGEVGVGLTGVPRPG